MAVPDFQAFMLPLLESLADGREHQMREVREQIAARLKLSEADRAELLPSAQQAVYDNRLGWAKTFLDKAGLLQTIKRGVYQITERGQATLASKPARIDVPYLTRFPEFVAFNPRSARRTDAPEEPSQPSSPPVGTPREALEAAYQQLRTALKSDLLASIMEASPQFFERLVMQLLAKMGYGGWLKAPGEVTGRPGDGGIDGRIKQDHLGLDVVYVQAKRLKDKVIGRPEVQAFAGSLEGERARKGVFIITSAFSREAREYVTRIEKKIVLIDGDELTSLMIDFDVGVSAIGTYAIKRVDTDYFSEE